MPDFYEDADGTPTALEAALLTSFPHPKLERLRKPMLQAVLEVKNPNAQARRVVQLAESLEPGALFDSYFTEEYLAAKFRSKNRLLNIDKALQPYYGLVNGAMRELRLANIDPVITDMWLEYFRQDNGHYRAQVIAGMCVTAAINELGFTVGV